MNLFLLPLWFLSGSFFPAAGAPAILQWAILLNPVSYAVSAIRQGLYYPTGSGLELAGIGISLMISSLCAVIVVGDRRCSRQTTALRQLSIPVHDYRDSKRKDRSPGAFAC
jgi:hypothetical protein